MAGRPIDLGRITSDVYAVVAEKDHIVPWKSAWKISRLAGTHSTHFALAGSGHIAGMISPPAKARGLLDRRRRALRDRREWRESAEPHEGTWWKDWTEWLEQRSGEKVESPRMGSDRHRPSRPPPAPT